MTEKDYIDVYKAKSYDEILEFLATPPQFCAYCVMKAQTQHTEWGISKKEIGEWT
jgi:hypothetical protein